MTTLPQLAGTPTDTPTVRARCPICLRAQRACICALAQPVQTEVELLILQHPLEMHEAKGTGRLLHLCLPRSRLLVGESWSPPDLARALHAPWSSSDAAALPPVRSLLLYPQPAGTAAIAHANPDGQHDATASDAALTRDHMRSHPLRLVLLDGTWRKSRKMLHLNPALSTLPRLALPPSTPSGYHIRKAQAPGQLSSFEAGMLALAQLQGWGSAHAGVQTLVQVFTSFLDQHASLRPTSPRQ